MTTKEITAYCSLCEESHTWTPEVEGCERCEASPHGPEHKGLFHPNRSHCTCDACF